MYQFLGPCLLSIRKTPPNCIVYAQVSKSNVVGVPGFVAKPGGGGRPVPARQLPRRLLWLPGALLSSVIDAFRKVLVPFRIRFLLSTAGV